MAAARKKSTRRAPARSSSPTPQSFPPEYYMPQPMRRMGGNPLLVGLVIVLAFFTGYLFFKVQSLEKTGGAAGQAAQEVGQPSVPTGPVDVDPGHLPVLGNEDAPVTIIEFADFQCPFCKKLFDEVEGSLKTDYIDTGKVKFYYRHYAFLGDESNWAAEASECANEQDKFWEFHNYLFTNQGGENEGDFSKENLKEFAANVGLNTAQFNECLDSGKFTQQVADDLAAGQAAGVDGTPSTFINGIMISGAQPYASFKAEIDKALNE